MLTGLLAARRILNNDIEYQNWELRAKYAWDHENHNLHALLIVKADSRAIELGMIRVAGFWYLAAAAMSEADIKAISSKNALVLQFQVAR